MPLLVVFVTANDDLIRIVAERQVALIPADLRTQNFAALGGEEVVLLSFKAEPGRSVSELVAYLESRELNQFSGVLLLTDGQMAHLFDALGDVFCINRFVPPKTDRNIGNHLMAMLAKALRRFIYFKIRFVDRKYQQVLRLPLRNFVAEEIGEMRAICRDIVNRDNFGRELDQVLQRLRNKRQRPKKASTSPITYLVDDDAKHFSLGHEKHARAETKMPPHNDFCLLANAFRFGCAFDGEHHFNVSKDRNSPMSGEYPDCHGQLRPGKGATHLNMFSSDFF